MHTYIAGNAVNCQVSGLLTMWVLGSIEPVETGITLERSLARTLSQPWEELSSDAEDYEAEAENDNDDDGPSAAASPKRCRVDGESSNGD